MTPFVTATTFSLHLIRILHVQLRFPKDDQVRAKLSATRDLSERFWSFLRAQRFKQSDMLILRGIAVVTAGVPFSALCSVPDRAFRLLHQ